MDNHHLGKLTIHHLIPRFRLRVYYGTTFKMPGNKLKLRELRHAAWHVLFGSKTLNEVIGYLSNTSTRLAMKQLLGDLFLKTKSLVKQ